MTRVAGGAAERPTFTRHLECSLTGDIYPTDKIHGLSRANVDMLERSAAPAHSGLWNIIIGGRRMVAHWPRGQG